MYSGEMCVRIIEADKSERARRRSRAAAQFGNAEFEAVRKIDADSVLGPRHRVADWFAAHFHDPLDR